MEPTRTAMTASDADSIRKSSPVVPCPPPAGDPETVAEPGSYRTNWLGTRHLAVNN